MAQRGHGRRRFIIAIAVATFTATAAVGVSGQDAAYADQNISHTFTGVSCVAQVGTTPLTQVQDITVSFVVADSVAPNSEFTITFPSVTRPLPSSFQTLTVTNYSNLSTTYQVQGGATFVPGSIVNPGTATLAPNAGGAPQTLTQTADITVSDKIKLATPGPFVPGTLTTPTITARIKAPAAGAVTVNAFQATQTVRLNNAFNAVTTCAIPTTTLATVPVVGLGPDLTVTKSHVGDFYPGQVGAEYELVVRNSGSATTSEGVSVADQLPEGLLPTAIAGTGWDCDLPSFSCTRSDPLSPDESYPPVVVTANVAATAPNEVTNVATVSGGGEVATSNNAATDLTTIVRPDLVVEKTHSENFHVGQEGAHYTLAVSNIGPLPSSGDVSVVDTLPSGLLATAISGDGWDCELSSLACSRSDELAPGAAYPTIDVTVDVPPTGTSNVTNTATVVGGGELNTANSSDSDATIIDHPDLTLTKSHAGSFSRSLGGSYTLVVSNDGAASTIGDIAVVDTLPSGMSATSLGGSGWSCELSTATCTTAATIAAGESLPPITLVVSVAPNAASHLTNVATVSGGTEINTSNNTATDDTEVASPVLFVSMSHAGDVGAGQLFTETITLSNTGSDATTGTVTVSPSLPTGVSVLGLTGTGWSCDTVALQCTRDDSLAAGLEFPPIMATLQAGSGLVGTVSLSATAVTGDEPNLITATATDEVFVLSTAKPYVTVSDSSVVIPGDGGQTTLTFEVELSWPFHSQTSARFSTRDRTASAGGGDYGSIAGIVFFVPGQTTETVSVVVNGTGEYGANETMQLALSAPVNALIGDATGTGTIVHPGGPVSVRINDVLVPRPATGTTTANFVLSLSAPSPGSPQIAVTVETVDATAKSAAGDYVPLSRTVITFDPGDQDRSVPITVNGGPAGTKTFKLRIVKAVGATIADQLGTATISR
jgi:uncharacterized repeat protein (TIGR01451 family)